MAATLYYFSTNVPAGADRAYATQGSGVSGKLNQGTTATDTTFSSDYLEFKVKTVLADGTTKTNITKRDIENFLELVRRWVHDQASAPSAATGQGLDDVILANSGTVGVP